ncbi:hypothetical protein IEQ34_016894 [Dendrobium chrysotoxum]|uniref:Ubiquitin-like protease family profile domain-containing protein n=1 Tax=Dendrobium chrysotoxum TaxID=161865 RepID=A0AAV7GGT9_DENCH|nr:hypothetical protein IEQ34_016894 [Dendrobium chrysotoxum]
MPESTKRLIGDDDRSLEALWIAHTRVAQQVSEMYADLFHLSADIQQVLQINKKGLHFKNYSPRASLFRNVFDSLKEFFTDEVKDTLKKLRILQFTEFPRFQQNTLLIYILLSCWDVSKQSFDIKGHELKFLADDIALLTGLPNISSLIYWEAEPLTSHTGIQIKNEIMNINKPTSPEVIVNIYIKRLITIAENIDEFNSYNWAMSIRDFLISQFDRLAPKYIEYEPLGYMSGFVPLLMIWFLEHTSFWQPVLPKARPRFLRWDINIFLLAIQFCKIFKDLRNEHPINYPSGVSTQANSIDCGIFLCKYMEELVKHEDVDWE